MSYITIKKINGDFYVTKRKSFSTNPDPLDENFEVSVQEGDFKQSMADSLGKRINLTYILDGVETTINIPQHRFIRAMENCND